MAEFKDRLKEAMDLRNLRQTDLAIKTGIQKGSLNNFIHGRYIPKTDKIYKIASALQVNPAWLLGYDVPIEENVPLPITTNNKTVEEIIKKVELLDEAQQQQILNVLNAMFPNKI